MSIYMFIYMDDPTSCFLPCLGDFIDSVVGESRCGFQYIQLESIQDHMAVYVSYNTKTCIGDCTAHNFFRFCIFDVLDRSGPNLALASQCVRNVQLYRIPTKFRPISMILLLISTNFQSKNRPSKSCVRGSLREQ